MIRFEQVSKHYPGGHQALQKVSFHLQQGEMAFLTGHSGAGKSTLINILAGNVKKTSGTVNIGGYDIDKKELETKKIIGIVPQDTGYDFVFTVDEALKKQSGYFGIKNNKEYIDELLDALYLTEKRSARIRDLSGGMRRRFLIAKALVHKPKILILDDSTSAVDTKTDALIRKAFREEIPDTTKIIIAQRVSSIEDADQIIVLDDGKIAGVGTSEELLQTNEIYREVYESQVKGGEEDE